MGRDNAHGGAAVGWTRTGGWGVERGTHLGACLCLLQKKPRKGLKPYAVGSRMMVAPGGIEPPTQGFSVLCSTY